MDSRLKITRVSYNKRSINYIAVDMDDLRVSKENIERFENETANSIRFSDIDEEGRLTNIRFCARVTGM